MQDQLRLKLGDIFWRKLYRPVLFRMGPENAHNAVNRHVGYLQENPHLLRLARWLYRSPHADHNQVLVCGRTWQNRVGIGPGIDKNAEQIPFWSQIAGSIEIGGVTPHPQEGRPKPRLFRISYTDSRGTKSYILVNRMGYPSDGASVISERLAEIYRRHHIGIPVIVQMAPNSETVAEYEKSRDLGDLLNDYLAVAEKFLPVLRPADYLSVGISPNTPGLRELFVERHEEFARGLHEGISRLTAARRTPPLIYKMPPFVDLGIGEGKFAELIAAIAPYANGIAATNTLTDKMVKARYDIREDGGVSGTPLLHYAWKTQLVIAETIRRRRLNLDLIGLGGVMSPYDAHMTIRREPIITALQLVSWVTRDGPIAVHKALEAIANP